MIVIMIVTRRPQATIQYVLMLYYKQAMAIWERSTPATANILQILGS